MNSNVSYHGDLEKKAAMEQKRNLAGDDTANGNHHHDDSGSGTNNNNNNNNNRRRHKKDPSRKCVPIPPAFLIKPVHGRMQCGGRKPLNRGRPLAIPEAFLYKPPPPPPSYHTGKTWSRISTDPPPSIPEAIIPEVPIPEASIPEEPVPEAPIIPDVTQSDDHQASFGHCAHCWTDVNGVHLFRNSRSIDHTVGGLLSEFLATTTPFQHLLIWM